jgi:2-polyprenyl-6-methoxyphenol hydroxylase-like FAD-dependent oxidoreductase
MARQYRIGVVGFGVAGGAVSYLLAKAGHRVTLLERAPKVGPVGAGVLLQPSGQAVLRKLGMLDAVVRRAEPVHELHAVTHRGRNLIRLPYGLLGKDVHAYGVHRGDLFGVLHDAVRAHDVEVRLGCEAHTCRARDGGVWLRDSHGDDHGPFDFVLAADGSRSRLRGDANLSKSVHEYPYGVVWATGRCDAVRGKLYQVTRGTADLLGLLPTGDDRCTFFISLRRDRKALVWSRGFAAWKDDVLRLCPLAEQVFDSVTGFDDTVFTTYQHVWMPRWYDHHVLFLGDAAHGMSPHLGQGVNLALLDAYHFAEVLATSPDHRSAFRRWAQERKRHVRFYAYVTYWLTPFFQSRGLVLGLGRDLSLPWMPYVPVLKRQMALTMAGLKTGFFGGEMRL